MPALPAHAAGMSVRAGECVQVHTSGVQSNTHSVCSRAVNTHTLTLSGNKNTLSTGRSRHTHSHTHTQSNTHTHRHTFEGNNCASGRTHAAAVKCVYGVAAAAAGLSVSIYR